MKKARATVKSYICIAKKFVEAINQNEEQRAGPHSPVAERTSDHAALRVGSA